MVYLGVAVYLLFAMFVAFLLKSKRVGFWPMFFLCMFFTPLLVAFMGAVLARE